MSEYLVQEKALSAVADSIREKIGTSELIEWKADIGFSDIISSIPTNGEITKNCYVGSILPASSVHSLEIEHNLNISSKDKIGLLIASKQETYHQGVNFILYQNNCNTIGNIWYGTGGRRTTLDPSYVTFNSANSIEVKTLYQGVGLYSGIDYLILVWKLN